MAAKKTTKAPVKGTPKKGMPMKKGAPSKGMPAGKKCPDCGKTGSACKC